MKRPVGLVLLALLILPAALPAAAEPLSRSEVPEPLRPWVDWVLRGHEEAACPFFEGDGNQRQCAWPSRLSLDLGSRTGSFTQQWLVNRKGWVPLPGDARYWPQRVRIDGAAGAVTAREGVPGLILSEGRHEVAGVFEWDALPPLLQVPTETGLLALKVRGSTVPFPVRDERGRLWLQKRSGDEGGENRLQVSVHRKATDDVPLVLTTRMDLQVSGKSREAVLGEVLPERFILMSMNSPLPARVEANGLLRVQVRPGRWTLEFRARHEGPVSTLTLAKHDEPWGADEVWVFEARPHLRLVTVEGVQEIDPQQTTLPEPWKQLPTYLVRPGQSMTLVEKRRGDSDPAPDHLTLQRNWWLDFDGSGYTIQDHISGNLQRSWRLEMLSPAKLGRAAINGRDQFITRSDGSGRAGVEVRQARLQMEADSRLDGGISNLPAVGWDHDFHQVSGQLNLSPGWRLFHAIGVDDVSSTWISSWTLLDLFLVLIVTMAFGRLWSARAGILALVTMVLIWIEPGAPRWIWLAVLAGEALVRALGGGRAGKWLRIYHGLAVVLLIVITVPFMVRQVRMAIYPALEKPWASHDTGVAGGAGFAGGRAEFDDFAEGEVPADKEVDELKAMAQVAEEAIVSSRASSAIAKRQPSQSYYAPDPTTIVQTGPGLPHWGWRTVSLSWRGPVEKTQRLRLLLVPPAMNLGLSFARVALLVILALCVLPLPEKSHPGAAVRRMGLSRAATGLLLFIALMLAASPPARADIPPSDLLNELRTRLLENPACFPRCATSPRMALEASQGTLQLRIDVHAAADTGVPLPGGAEQWVPRQVLVDGSPAAGLTRTPDGRLWVRLSRGAHQILMQGELPNRESVPLPLPLKPYRVTAQASGWRLEGLREDGRVADTLQLIRVGGDDGRRGDRLEPGQLPPFVSVERGLNLGLKWQVSTQVVRLTPAGAAIVLQVPLLPGESVTTEGVRVVDGLVAVSMGPGVTQMAWESTLPERPAIELIAPESVAWAEVWRLAASPIWHLDVSGIPVVHTPEQPVARVQEWRPWPGENVSIKVTRPEGIPGQSLTIDSSVLTLNPGLRATDATLETVFRSSRGAQHTLTLPGGSQLQAVTINGETQPIRQEGLKVTLPVSPGRQEVTLTWRQQHGISPLFRTPEVDMGLPSVNSEIRINMPRDRWSLFLGGPRLGPAVLFWSFLIVSLLMSLGLGQVRLTPLRWYHWFLLSLGLTQVSLPVALLVVAWLIILGWRGQRGTSLGTLGFNTLQLSLIALSFVAFIGLFLAIKAGLLGLPEMQIAGNGSSAYHLKWYQDRVGPTLPTPWAVSFPIMVYRLAMLAWALWLAQALLGWLRWGWQRFGVGGYWRAIKKKAPVPKAPPAPPAAPTPAPGTSTA